MTFWTFFYLPKVGTWLLQHRIGLPPIRAPHLWSFILISEKIGKCILAIEFLLQYQQKIIEGKQSIWDLLLLNMGLVFISAGTIPFQGTYLFFLKGWENLLIFFLLPLSRSEFGMTSIYFNVCLVVPICNHITSGFLDCC